MSHLRLRLCVVLGALLALAFGNGALAAPNHLVISQVYGGGGNSGAPFTHDFIEVFNPTNADITLDGLSLQYASGTGAGFFGSSSTQLTELSGTLLAGQYLLVQEASGTAGVPLPPADIVDPTPIAMGAAAGKVALVTGVASLGCNSGANCTAPQLARIIDLVGFGTTLTTNFWEGAAPTGALSNTTAALRRDNACQDTDQNGADFTVGAPAPRNKFSARVVCDEPTTNPTGTGSASPASVDAGSSTVLTVSVTPGTGPASTGLAVTADLSSIGGSATQAFASGAGNVFTFTASVPVGTSAGPKTLPVTITDTQSRSGTTSIALTITTPAEPPGLGTPLVINEFRFRGPAGGNDEFVELYNASSSTISIGGLKVSGSNNAGTTSVRATIPAGKVLGSGCYYLLTNSGAYSGAVTGDQTYGTGVTDDGGLALQAADNTILDQVGLSTGSAYKEGTPLASLGSSNLDRGYARKAGGRDTNDNAADFVLATPSTPQSTATCGVNPDVDDAPTVSATTPTAGATDVALAANVAITFSEPVAVTDGWYSISCTTSGAHTASATGGPVTFTLDPATNFVGGEQCTVTVFAAFVSDQDTNDPPDASAANYVFTFRTLDAFNCGDAATLIHEIQGTGPTAAQTGSQTIEGVVTFDSQATGQFSGYFVQEEVADQDSNPMTSEGIFVFSGSGVDNVSAGEIVRVRGTAAEAFGMTQLSSISALAKCGLGSVPATPVSLPVANVGDHESFEGMLVSYSQTLTATEVFNLGRFGEVSLSGAGRLYNSTAVAAPGAPALAVAAQNARSRIILDDASNFQNVDPTRYPQGGLSATNTLRVGDSLNGLTGILEFRFSNYRIQPVGDVNFDHTNLRTPAPAAVGGNLKIASFNVLNYFNGDGLGGGFPTSRGAESRFEFDRQEAKIVSALAAIDADIVGLMEIENDAAPNSAIEELVAALNAATAPGTYAFVDTGVIGTDAIKVALIYKPSAVSPVGDWKIITSAVDPRFIDTRNRPSLAQTFRHNTSGQALTVVVNHLKSKGSACTPDDPDTGDGSGNCNGTRTQAAAALADWLATDPTGSGDPDFMIIGDLNSYTFETPITTLEADGYTNLVREYGGLTAYSYVFNGESGYLDHALGTASMAAQVTGVSDWHINPDEPTVLDYNTNFKSANHVSTLYDPGPYRASDHDPVIIGLQLNHAPTADAGGPYTVGEGGSVTLAATGSDADGDSLAYAWDLDNDGDFDDATGQSVSFSAAAYDGPVTRTIRVRVSDAGSSTVDEATVTVTNVAPTATFNAPATTLAGSPFTLSLTNGSDAAPADVPTLQYAFDCGGGYGAFSASNTTSCPTDSTGTRSVGGKVRDDDGGVTEYRATVKVTSIPTVDAGGPYTVAEGGSVTVAATGSDADGDPLTYAWDLDNDADFDDANGQSASFSAAAIDGPATRTIRVRVSDGTSSTVDDATVNVMNVAPTATFNAPASSLAGSPFTLSLTNAQDAAPADVPGLQYAFDCGSGYGAFSASNTMSCPTDSTGTRSVGGKVRDDDGGVTEYRATVNVTVTFASLCALVQASVDKEGVAQALCSKLEAAAAKADRKDQEADLHAFVNQVEAQSGKSMTAAEAATLIRLAGDL